jgi:aromatic ring-opening dioxygenase catalytic subunit (LigB family)
MGDEGHRTMIDWLKKFAATYLSKNKPTACLVISAHWEAPVATVQSGDTSSLYYDYYNFPKETYNLSYPVAPAKHLSQRVTELLKKANIPNSIDSKRGYDHGVFIPMMLIYPDADIPTIQLSLVSGLDPQTHIKIGEALAPLRDEGVFILGSGMSYHNMRGFGESRANKDSEPFHQYLRDTLNDDDNSSNSKKKTYAQKVQGLMDWKKAPKARENHPREEHLIPLMCIAGTSSNSGGKSKEVFYDDVIGVKCSGYVFD